MKKLFALPVLLIFALTVRAEAPDSTAAPDDPAALKAQAEYLIDEARAIRAAAKDEYARAQKACWNKILVSHCQEESGQTYRDEKLKASRLESQARAIEREITRRKIAEKDARRAADDAARDKP
jgi:hypothetical protein